MKAGEDQGVEMKKFMYVNVFAWFNLLYATVSYGDYFWIKDTNAALPHWSQVWGSLPKTNPVIEIKEGFTDDEKLLILSMTEAFCRYEVSDEKKKWFDAMGKGQFTALSVQKDFHVGRIAYTNFIRDVKVFLAYSGFEQVTNRYAAVLHADKQSQTNGFCVYINMNMGLVDLRPRAIYVPPNVWFLPLLPERWADFHLRLKTRSVQDNVSQTLGVPKDVSAYEGDIPVNTEL